MLGWMTMWKAEWLVGASIVGVLAFGCQRITVEPAPELTLEDAEAELERVYCEQMFECSCEGDRAFDSVSACTGYIRDEIDALQERPDRTGITYDPSCLAETIAAFEELGCAQQRESDDGECLPPCHIFHGEIREGGTCKTTTDGVYSDCAGRMVCSPLECGESGSCTGTCYEPSCEPDAPCGTCDEGTHCDENTQTCVPSGAADGEPCTGHSQCASRSCPAGYCERLPVEGETCRDSSACAGGARCDFTTMLCVPGDALLCSIVPELE